MAGARAVARNLAATLASVNPSATALGVRVQLDPTFQPHFDLYDGLVFKLVCQGADAARAIASGGRYDKLVGRFCSDAGQAAGMGFGFVWRRSVTCWAASAPAGRWAGPGPGWWPPHQRRLADGLEPLAGTARRGEAAELGPRPCAARAEADSSRASGAAAGRSGCLPGIGSTGCRP